MGDNNLKTPQADNKRKSSVLSPPPAGLVDTKKNKMASTEKPDWANEFATKDYMDDLFNRFKKEIITPLETKLMGRMDKIEKDVESLDSIVKDLPARITNTETEFKNSIEFQSKSIGDVKEEVSDLKSENKRLESKLNQLYEMVESDHMDKADMKNKLTDMEDRSRRDNLVIEGLSDTQGETPRQCEEKAKTFFKDTLKVNNADNLVIGRCHRIGKFDANKCRQTIVKFDRFKQREAVFQKGKSLGANSHPLRSL